MKYEPSLDGIRGLGIASVVFFHAYEARLPGGWLAVDMFFVLSGYLITRILDSEVRRSGRLSLPKFFYRRVLRLGPAFAAVLAFRIVIALLSHNHRASGLQETLISATYLMDWSMALHWRISDLLGHTWSLAVEEQFYLLWPLAFLFVRKPGRWPLVVMAAIACLTWRCWLIGHGASPDRTYFGPDTRGELLLAGCLLALTQPSPALARMALRFAWAPIAFLAVILVSVPRTVPLANTFGYSALGIASAWIVLAALQPGWLKTALSFKPLVYTGRLSYGWYLWHYPLGQLAKVAALRPGAPHWVSLTAVPIAIVGSFVIAVASRHLLEEPFLRLKARLERRPSGVEAVEPTAVPVSLAA